MKPSKLTSCVASLLVAVAGPVALIAMTAACRGPSATPAVPLDPTPAGTHPDLTAAKENATVPSKTFVKPPLSELKQKLTPLQFEVTQNDATEPPFRNDFWNNHQAGIYVDVATGEPLFSSVDKFESGTGWPSFTRPIEDGHVVSKTDTSYGTVRTEVRSSAGDSHLGHVFDDGPAPTGQRYCINSASLRFVPVDRLSAEGYGAYAAPFSSGKTAPAVVATDNACAKPPPGEKAGCEATLDTALFTGGAATATALRGVPGVLEVDAEADKLRVVFDPKRVARADLATLVQTHR
jgi:peptide methionine sulfoxide reductase msrA/msrB